MKKIIGFLICISLSIGLLALALTTDILQCSGSNNSCTFVSKIKYANINLNKVDFNIEDLNKAYCQKEIQPSKRGTRSYYILKIDINGQQYNISSYNKYKPCRYDEKQINHYIKNSQQDFKLESSNGFLNVMGIMFAIIFAVVGILILKKEPPKSDPFEDNEEEI